MNATPNCLVRLLRSHVPGLTVAGLALGCLAATFVYTVEKPVFESTAVCRPLRPAADVSGVPHREWLNTEAAAMGMPENLRRVVRNLNLTQEWGRSEGECIDSLVERLDISIVPETTLVRVGTRGRKNTECAALVNAVIAARGEYHREAQGHEPALRAAVQSSRVESLVDSCAKKRAALLEAMKSVNILLAPAAGDAELMALTLPKLLDDARRDWFAETVRLAGAKANLAAIPSPLSLPAYAEILEQGSASLVPVSPLWLPRAATWTVAGSAAGLSIGILLLLVRRCAAFRPPGPRIVPPQPAVIGEY